MKTLQDLFLHHLKDIYHAEKQMLRATPQLMRKSESPELKQALERHRDETTQQVERLEQIFELIDKRARGEPCEAILGLIQEAKDVMEQAEDPDVRDAGIIGAAQAMEHYEIARYGTMRAWAEQLGMKEAVQLLEATLEEEKRTDALLSELAVNRLNREAA